MKRRLALAVLAFLVLSADASDPRPVRIDKKPRPAQCLGNVVGVMPPGAWVQPNAPELEPLLNDRLVEVIVCPDLMVARWTAKKLALRQARAEWHRFWMNNQPSVLSYDRLNGAIGP
jgi:hypothetical protein